MENQTKNRGFKKLSYEEFLKKLKNKPKLVKYVPVRPKSPPRKGLKRGNMVKPIPAKMITRNCIICGTVFSFSAIKDARNRFAKGTNPVNRATCSEECHLKNNKVVNVRAINKKKNTAVKKKCRQCNKEIITNAYCPINFCGGNPGICYRTWLSENRKGKNNPAYRNGEAVKGKRTYTGLHLRACAKYRKDFKSKHDYLFCEVCGVNQNGTPRFEVHHIYFASLFPKHKELHNFKNLILICIGCHNKFHSSKLKEEFKVLEKERGLKELFGVKV